MQCLDVTVDNQIISGSQDELIKIWHLDECACHKTLMGHTDSVMCVKSLTRNRAVSGSYKELIVWDLKTEKCLHTLQGHTNWVKSVIQVSENVIASGSYDGSIKLWDLTRGVCVKTLVGHKNAVYSLILLQNGLLASGSSDKNIKLWNLDSGACVHTLKDHKSCVWNLQLTPRGDELVSCAQDRTVLVWDLSANISRHRLFAPVSQVSCIMMLGEVGGDFASGLADGKIELWSEKKGHERVRTLESHATSVNDLHVVTLSYMI